jgi:hypothetical protein
MSRDWRYCAIVKCDVVGKSLGGATKTKPAPGHQVRIQFVRFAPKGRSGVGSDKDNNDRCRFSPVWALVPK